MDLGHRRWSNSVFNERKDTGPVVGGRTAGSVFGFKMGNTLEGVAHALARWALFRARKIVLPITSELVNKKAGGPVNRYAAGQFEPSGHHAPNVLKGCLYDLQASNNHGTVRPDLGNIT